MKPMDVVKKNLVSIICGVVALAALVFYFVGAKPKLAEVGEQMETRVAKPKELQQLLGSTRTLPVTNESKPPEKLGYFPNEKAIGVAEAVVAQLKGEAKKVMDQAVSINKAGRELLVPGTLPKPRDPTLGYNFRDAYKAVLARGGKPDPAWTKTPNLPDGILRSAEPPSDAEIAAEKQKLWASDYATQVIIQDNQPRNLKEVAADFLKATANFDQDFRRKRAREHKIYLEPNALVVSPTMANATAVAPTPQDMWYCQMALWVQQDVCNALTALNDSNPLFKDIPSCPVKHLLALDVQPAFNMYVLKGGTAPAAAPPGGDPNAVVVPPTEPSARDYVLSPTGRVSNSLYDVVQFRLSVVVQADSIRSLIQQLQFGRFMSVLEVDVKGVDLDQALDEGYGYGSLPVVEVKLRCEALFLRDWTAWQQQPNRSDGAHMPPVQGPMPIEVQRLLGVPTPNLDKPPELVAPAAPVAMQ